MARNTKGLSAVKLRELARSGADVLLRQLRAEIVAIERTFPELAISKRRRAVRRSLQTVSKRGREVSQAARKEISRRMKRYWNERRKAQAKMK